MGIFVQDSNLSNINAYYGLTFKQFDMPPHVHKSACEIMYAVKGKCTIYLCNEMLHLTPNQFIFIDKNIHHRLMVEEGGSCTLLNLEFSLDTDTNWIDIQRLSQDVNMFNSFLNNKHPYIVLHDTGNMCYALKDLIMELESKRMNNTYLIDILFTRMLIEMSYCAERNNNLTGIVYIRKAKQYIIENLEEDLNVSLIAKAAEVNGAHLQKLFKKYFDRGIMTYVNGLRLDKAGFLLKNTKMSITDIAFKVGFNNRQNFGLVFTKAYDMSPNQYRKLTGNHPEVETGTFKGKSI